MLNFNIEHTITGQIQKEFTKTALNDIDVMNELNIIHGLQILGLAHDMPYEDYISPV